MIVYSSYGRVIEGRYYTAAWKAVNGRALNALGLVYVLPR